MPQAAEPIALVDLDGTLADFDGSMAAKLAALRSPGEDPDIEAYGKEKHPWLEARRDVIKSQPGFWRNLPRITDGFAVLEMIRRVGFEVHVLTKGPFRTTMAWTEKVEWCRANLPDIPVTITEDKGLVYGRVLFDDWPPYIERWLAWRPRGLVIMLDHPWNQGFEHPNVLRYKRLNDRHHELYCKLKERRAGVRADFETSRQQLMAQNDELFRRLTEAKNRGEDPTGVVKQTPSIQEFYGLTSGCHAGRDGECNWASCPQTRDGEPHLSGRHCPLDNRTEE